MSAHHDLDQIPTPVNSIPNGTPIALVFIAEALLFLPTIIGVGSGNLGGLPDFQDLVTDVVGLLHHPHDMGF